MRDGRAVVARAMRFGWHAASDLDAYPFEDESTQWPDREAEYYESLDADYEQFLSLERRDKNNAESPRRQKLFRKAEAAMSVMVALRGRYAPPITVKAWHGRHGRRVGLFTYYDDDHEIQWTPRLGFRVLEVADIPF
jgi:hypothetical protein